MILIFGGTTEGRAVVKVVEQERNLSFIRRSAIRNPSSWFTGNVLSAQWMRMPLRIFVDAMGFGC